MMSGLLGNYGRDEELRAVRVLARVGHAKESRLGVLELEVFIWELCTIDCE